MSISSSSHLSNFIKVTKLGLWSIWLSGFLLICLSLYATQLLGSLTVEIRKPFFYNQKGLANDERNPSITIFSTPTVYNGSVEQRQDLAIRSWLGLSPNINLVLFGNHPWLHSFAAAFGSRVIVESSIDFSFLNTPFFHSMVARAEASSSDISVLVHPETILFPDFVSTLSNAHELDHDWFLVAFPRRVSAYPFALDEANRKWLRENGKAIRWKKLQEFLKGTWKWDYCEERMLMAWNTRDLPLHMGVLPPFLYGKGLHYRWLINEVYNSNYRLMFDASWTLTSLYVHDTVDNEPLQTSTLSTLTENGKMDWENNGNLHLSEVYGMFSSHEVLLSDFVKLVKCDGRYIFMDKEQNIVYSRRQRSLNSWQRIVQSRREKKVVKCITGFVSLAGEKKCFSESMNNLSVPINLPFGLETLLPVVADENKTIVLAVAGYSYQDMLMSWVCRLRRLMMRNFLICALDDETYEFSILQGLPVFRDPLAPRNISFNDCHFGTKCFQKVTKTKSRLVLQILKLGYNVLLSDVDVYWFKNPIPLLQAFGPAILVAQSDEYNVTVPINLPRRLNSGFYFARSDGPTISALEKVVKHAMTSELSEQPSFYDTLCGPGGLNRVGNDRCKEPETNLTVQFLDIDLFPNGAYQGLWEERSVREVCAKKGCYVLHNNWISGRLKKLERQVHSGLWDYDVSSRMCLQSWHNVQYVSSDLEKLDI